MDILQLIHKGAFRHFSHTINQKWILSPLYPEVDVWTASVVEHWHGDTMHATRLIHRLSRAPLSQPIRTILSPTLLSTQTPFIRHTSNQQPPTSFINKAKEHGAQSILGPFLASNGWDGPFEQMQVLEMSKDKPVNAVCLLPVDEKNAARWLHFYPCTMALLAVDNSRGGVSVDINVNYLQAISVGDSVRIEGKVLKLGKTLGFTESVPRFRWQVGCDWKAHEGHIELFLKKARGVEPNSRSCGVYPCIVAHRRQLFTCGMKGKRGERLESLYFVISRLFNLEPLKHLSKRCSGVPKWSAGCCSSIRYFPSLNWKTSLPSRPSTAIVKRKRKSRAELTA
ncbi:acyl-CoA thioesterase 13 [Planoprotostelium fungivorum]|uniref:Acyl-CoA thioesterase 13 n=1 Tax=Planoprotostelium fungivorum TaxID=1890364 RepID=A0A2P6NAA3_9EUKA|nr:acyl-CoA thioesterase 13 [Planoprotostelium fungivorum]